MLSSVAEHAPELIIAPMLKSAIPEAIWSRYICLIVHPGIKGDRGASSLDWAIMTGEKTWGVTILQAAAEMDAGPIWATREFPLDVPRSPRAVCTASRSPKRPCSACWRPSPSLNRGSFQPEPLAYGKPDVRGRLRPTMRQSDRAIDWRRDSTDTVVRKIARRRQRPRRAGRSVRRRVLTSTERIAEDRLKGAPGRDPVPAGRRDLPRDRGRRRLDHASQGQGPRSLAGIKLPAVHALGPRAARRFRHSELSLDAAVDYRTFREIRYVREGRGRVPALRFLQRRDEHRSVPLSSRRLPLCAPPAHAGDRAARRPRLLLQRHPSQRDRGGGDPAMESWRNINAIDDLVHEILTTRRIWWSRVCAGTPEQEARCSPWPPTTSLPAKA